MECSFIDCNLSNGNKTNTTFKEVSLRHSKMMGLRFDTCNSFLVDFIFLDCLLDMGSFAGMELKKQKFTDCKLIGIDFSDSKLPLAVFDNCDMNKAIFSNSDLSKVNYSTTFNITLNPKENKLPAHRFI